MRHIAPLTRPKAAVAQEDGVRPFKSIAIAALTRLEHLKTHAKDS